MWCCVPQSSVWDDVLPYLRCLHVARSSELATVNPAHSFHVSTVGEVEFFLATFWADGQRGRDGHDSAVDMATGAQDNPLLQSSIRLGEYAWNE